MWSSQRGQGDPRAAVEHDPGSSVTVTWTDTLGASQTATVVLTTGPPA
jgi:hypothetical protein